MHFHNKEFGFGSNKCHGSSRPANAEFHINYCGKKGAELPQLHHIECL